MPLSRVPARIRSGEAAALPFMNNIKQTNGLHHRKPRAHRETLPGGKCAREPRLAGVVRDVGQFPRKRTQARGDRGEATAWVSADRDHRAAHKVGRKEKEPPPCGWPGVRLASPHPTGALESSLVLEEARCLLLPVREFVFREKRILVPYAVLSGCFRPHLFHIPRAAFSMRTSRLTAGTDSILPETRNSSSSEEDPCCSPLRYPYSTWHTNLPEPRKNSVNSMMTVDYVTHRRGLRRRPGHRIINVVYSSEARSTTS